MLDFLVRTELVIGRDGIDKLSNAKVAVFGIGGVGSYAVEALARCGVGKLVLVDCDTIAPSNINRQIHALHSTVGQPKVEAMAKRVRDINPDIELILHEEMYVPEKRYELIKEDYDYVIDAVDTVTAKIDIIVACKEMGIPVISSMGAGNKMNPTEFQVSDIHKTSVCPLAKVMRLELKKRGIKNVKVVYSKEEPVRPKHEDVELKKENTNLRKRFIPGSISFVPSTVGLILASEVVKDLIK